MTPARTDGRADGHQLVGADAPAPVAGVVDLGVERLVRMAQQEIHLAVRQHVHPVVQRGGDDFQLERRHALLHAGHHARQHGMRQRLARGDGDLAVALLLGLLQRLACVAQDVQHVDGRSQHAAPRRVEGGGLMAALNQRHARPFLKRLDAAPERRMRHAARLGRLEHVARLR
ncbi:hypothetical protein G6F35_016923 [Rhizopus arrhizus]|nr:hypothetical protein G6F35_016923 [Rhizopus arrhizus]